VSGWLFTRLDWLIAWRHLRGAEGLPSWVRPLILGSLYLIAVGLVMAWHASTLEVPASAAIEPPSMFDDSPFDRIGAEDDDGATPLARTYGAFGGFTLLVGLMALVFGLLSWAFNLLPTIITMSVLLGCMALVVVLSLMSGLEGDLRDKILNQKAHIRVSREDARPFGDYPDLAAALEQAPGVAGASPYLEGEIMVRSGLNRQGAILSGIVPDQQARVSNLPTLVREGSWTYLEHPEDIPEPDPFAFEDGETPWRLRHLEEQRKKAKDAATQTGPKLDTDEKGDETPQRRNDDVGLGVGGEGLREALDAEGDGDWEDPAQELVRRDIEGLDERAQDDAPVWSPRLADRLPPPPQPDPDPEPGPDPHDEWEDPAEEIRQLRDDGVLPPEPDSPAPPEGPPPDTWDDDDDDWAAQTVIDPILIGRELSMELGVRVGAQVQLITPIGRMTPAGRIPGVLGARVGGIFFSGMYEYDRKNVYAPLPVVQRFLRTGDRVSGIEVKLENVERMDAGKAAVLQVVDQLGRSDELMVEDWRDLNRNLFSAMFLEKVAMFIALLFVVLVASFGILASNLMSVMEKAKEIAILKAMGTTDRGILRVFIAEGLCVGILGSFGGIAMGLGLCWALDRYGLPLNENVYYIEKLPVVVNPVEVGLVGISALVIVCISSLYPALVASRLRPVEALRHADQ
jgi:ABC-type lipoprotein release transport system permease subunit